MDFGCYFQADVDSGGFKFWVHKVKFIIDIHKSS